MVARKKCQLSFLILIVFKFSFLFNFLNFRFRIFILKNFVSTFFHFLNMMLLKHRSGCEEVSHLFSDHTDRCHLWVNVPLPWSLFGDIFFFSYWYIIIFWPLFWSLSLITFVRLIFRVVSLITLLSLSVAFFPVRRWF